MGGSLDGDSELLTSSYVSILEAGDQVSYRSKGRNGGVDTYARVVARRLPAPHTAEQTMSSVDGELRDLFRSLEGKLQDLAQRVEGVSNSAGR